MRVLFDFDLWSDPDIDLHLVDILLALKRALLVQMQGLENEINQEQGEFVIVFLPKNVQILYSCSHSSGWNSKVAEIINSFDWASEIEKFGKSELN